MGAEIVGDDVPLPVIRKMPAGDHLGSGKLGAAFIQAVRVSVQNARGLIVERPETDSRKRVMNPAIPRAIGHERIAIFIPRMSPMIDQPVPENSQPLALRPIRPRAAREKPSRPPRRFNVRMN